MNCYITCAANADCDSTGACCSEGYCTDNVVCLGYKATGDTCDVGTECLTTYCDITTKTCNTLPIITQNWNYIEIIAFILGGIVLIMFASYCYFKRRAFHSNHYEEREVRHRRVKKAPEEDESNDDYQNAD